MSGQVLEIKKDILVVLNTVSQAMPFIYSISYRPQSNKYLLSFLMNCHRPFAWQKVSIVADISWYPRTRELLAGVSLRLKETVWRFLITTANDIISFTFFELIIYIIWMFKPQKIGLVLWWVLIANKFTIFLFQEWRI